MSDRVPDTAIDHREVMRHGGHNFGNEEFDLFKCPACGRIYLFECEIDTIYLDALDLSLRSDMDWRSFRCIGCGRRLPTDKPWVGPNADPRLIVTWPELEASGWDWVAHRPGRE
jgi:hypothetical protein